MTRQNKTSAWRRTIGLAAGVALGLAATAVGAADDVAVGGRATFKGTPPARKPINTAADSHCAAHKPPMTEDVMVDKEGGLKNAVVWVSAGLPEAAANAPAAAGAAPVVIDQVGCTYTPHVVGVLVGQVLKVTNGDETLHNVHGLPRQAQEFNIVQNAKGAANEFKFTEPETPGFVLKCDVHPWMRSYVWVFPNKYFAISKEDGTFELPALPPGKYTLSAWQEKCGTQERAVTVEAGKPVKVDLTFELKKRG